MTILPLLVLIEMIAVGYDIGTQMDLICRHLMIKITQRYGTSQSIHNQSTVKKALLTFSAPQM